MEDRPKRNINKPKRYQTTSSDEADVRTKPMMDLQNSQLDNDITELREVLENHSPGVDAHPSHSLTYPQSVFDNNARDTSQPSNTSHTSDTRHTNDTTHSITYNQPLTSHTTQAFCPSVTSHSQTYTQSLHASHTIQVPHMYDKSQSYNIPQNSHVNLTPQTFTHEPHVSVPAHTQHIDSRLNTLYDTHNKVPNNWSNENRDVSISAPSSSRGSGMTREICAQTITPDVQ